jgi:hypothetical protein
VKTVVYRFGILCFIALCVLGLGHYFSVSAQDNARVEVKMESPPTKGPVIIGGGDNVIYMEAEPNSTEPVQRTFIKSDDGKTVIIDAGKSGSAKTEKQINKEEKKELNREMRQMNKDGSSQADMENKGAKKMRENKQDQGKEQSVPSMPNASPQAPSPQGQPPAPNNDGVNLYINAITGKSLFMPLGFVKKEQKASYVLTGVVSNAENITSSKAFIEQTGAKKSFYVSAGDTVGDVKVTEISEWGAKLDRSGEQIALKLGEGTRSGGMEGSKGGGERQRGGGDQKPGSETKKDIQADGGGGSRGNFDASKLPPFVQQMLKERGISIEELQNNPELQQKLRQEMMQRFQGGEGGGRRGGGGSRD